MTLTELEQEMRARAKIRYNNCPLGVGSQTTRYIEKREIKAYIAGYQAGFKRGAEIMREEALKLTARNNRNGYLHGCKCAEETRELPIPEIGGT